VALSLGGRELARGRGRSKKEAEQQAASRALLVLDEEAQQGAEGSPGPDPGS
jgi:dsRNA-specific ribonuclease